LLEIESLKQQKNMDKQEIRTLKIEIQKLELLYKKFKSTQNDVYTMERVVQHDAYRNSFVSYSKEELMGECEKVKRALLFKINQSSRLSSPKTVKVRPKIGKQRNICRTCELVNSTKQRCLGGEGTAGTSQIKIEESVGKSLLRIQMKNLQKTKKQLQGEL
jgi:hypothetical protein